MGKGSPPIYLRIPQELHDEVARTIVRRNAWTEAEPWNWQGFILAAVREKLLKMERSRKPRRRQAATQLAPDLVVGKEETWQESAQTS